MKLFTLILSSAISLAATAAPAKSNVRHHLDPEAAKNVHLQDDYVFEYEVLGCKVRWDMYTYKERPSERSIVSRVDCPVDKVYPAFAELLDTLVKQHPQAPLKSLTVYGWSQSAPTMEQMALASLDAPEWKSVLDARRAKRFESGNREFVAVYNRIGAGAELQNIFKKHGYTLTLDSVEKVMEGRASELKIAVRDPRLKASKQKVAFSAGGYSFRITMP